MKINKCDKCGKSYDSMEEAKEISLHEDNWRYSIVRDNYPYPESKVDLCLDCRKKLAEWLKGENNDT